MTMPAGGAAPLPVQDSVVSPSFAGVIAERSLERLTRLVTALLGAPATGVPAAPHVIAPSGGNGATPGVGPRITISVAAGGGFEETLALADLSADPRAAQLPDDVRAQGRSCVAVPIRVDEGTQLATLYVVDAEPREWTAEERATLEDIAGWLGTEVLLRRDLATGRSHEEQLLRHSLHDTLTGLPNRTLFLDRLRHAAQRARRHAKFQFGVLYLGLDRLKMVNESLGHEAGDELLETVARRLETCIRGEDTAARLGGDEFAILLEDVADESNVLRVVERIRRALATPVALGAFEVFTSASIGIAISSAAPENPEYMLRCADTAMWRAKRTGPGRYEMFDEAMHARAVDRLRVETDLRRAVERSEFVVHYQPVMSPESGTIVGVEALVRWDHPERGRIAPGEFIPLAEETGLIVPISTWVIRQACTQLRIWQDRFPRPTPLFCSVNVSVKHFAQPDLVEQVTATVRETGIDPSSLKLEITESVIVDNDDLARHVLLQLKALGVQVYLDDFGTGYSSLGYLHRLPLDAIKIDRSFVGQMEADDRSYQLVRTVRLLARSVGLSVVAEGVETNEQLRAIRGLGCEFAQGFLFSKPVSVEEVDALLAQDPHW
jgi:diguanylate cyclase (GGDEF)-like protein